MDASDLSTTHVSDPARLAALRNTALLDTPTEEAFDRLSRLAVSFVNAPVALVTLIDADRQFFKSCIGLPEPWCSRRESPLSHSFCKYNRIAGQPLIIEDARVHPLFKDCPAIWDLQVIAYLGIPLITSDGYVLGSFCVIDSKPRQWSKQEVAVVQDLAAAVIAEIQLRTEISARNRAENQRDELSELNKRLHEEITARKHAEEQQRQLEYQLHQAQKIEAIGRLAGGVAHDFNNLLSPIIGYSEILTLDPSLTEKQKQFTSEILRAGFHARDLVRQLLAFSRKQILDFKSLNINEAIERFSKLLRRTIPEDIEIRMILSPDIRPVMADAGQIEQIVMNLAVNAADAMPHGGRLTIETALAVLDGEYPGIPLDVAPGLYVMLAVSDTGHGMDQEVRDHIFEPFFSTKGQQGTGLGLATIFGIVKQHGGSIRLNSKPDEGTTFIIYLPVGEETPVEAENNGMTTDLASTETILLVEDSEQVRNLTKTILKQHGYTIIMAENGEEALRALASHKGQVQLLLADVVMPGMNGKELYEQAVRENPGMKVLYMSGYTSDIIISRGFLDEGVNFLQKPFTKKELTYRIREILDHNS